MVLSFKSCWKTVVDSLWPIYCLGCDKEGAWVCKDCALRIDDRGVNCCPVCHDTSLGGACCARCKDNSALDSVFALMVYNEDWLIGKLIHTFKYAYAYDCASFFFELIAKNASQLTERFVNIDAVVAVPLHRRRFAERGFNQAEIIAGFISHTIGKPLLPALVRTRYTERQARLKKPDREKNVHGAFKTSDNTSVFGKRILLVDDVYTTGSTMQECAKILRAGGAAGVSGFTLARG